ncbi:hypothetical protein ACOTHJ_32160 [Achromobacter xylosoxidans]|uniref:hypothetical protein n=1 Tax=Alcaligenes xylosoxydans xylosoxydans TaxID=85698 RepID=UPI0011B76F89|nr:hypothetical protein [Achromobacter xylosoxidans]
MKDLVENQDARELDFAANKTGPGALEETVRDFLAGRTARCVQAGARRFVVAAVWVYRGSVAARRAGHMPGTSE